MNNSANEGPSPNGRRRPKKSKPTDETLPLFDYGATAKATRAAAFENAKPKLPDRRKRAMAVLRERGTTGCTRHELAHAMGIPLQSVCGIAADILTDGLAAELGERRPTPTGSLAAVIVAVEVSHAPA